VIPDNLRYASGYADWPKSSSRTEKAYYSRLFLNANATVFKSFHGQHTMKFGGRYERLGTELNQGAQFPTITMYWNSNRATADGRLVRGQYGYYRVRQIYTSGTANSNNFSFWAQDSWTVGDRLTINAGIRTENEHVPNFSSGGSAISFGFQEKLAPRVGFAYDLQGNGKWKAYGSYGHFFDITKLMLPIGAFGGDKWVDYYYTLDTFNWPSISCADGKTGEGCPGTLIERQDMRHNSAWPTRC
jgi:outer membrane receptor protein involved in Fe transport